MDEKIGVALDDYAAVVAPLLVGGLLLGLVDEGLVLVHGALLLGGLGGSGLALGDLLGRVLLKHALDAVDGRLDRQLAGADRREEVLGAHEVELLHDLVDRLGGALVGDAVAALAQLVGDVAPPLLGVVGLARRGEVLADLGLGRGGRHEVEPVAARLGVLVREDLDAVTALEAVRQRDDHAVDLGAHAVVADLGVDGVGEVERRRVAPEAHDLALRREDEDLVLEEVDAQAVQELGGVAHLVVGGPVEASADPADLRVDALVVGRHVALGVAGALVEPVRGDAVLGLVVHVEGADLDLDGARVRADHGGVQRLVAVGLGHGDVVLEAPGQRVPERVDGAERGVAVAHRDRQDAQCDQVVDVGEVLALARHLLVDGPEVLRASRDLVVRQSYALELAVEGLDGARRVLFSLCARVLHHAGDALVLLGLEVEEGQVLELPLDRRDAQAVGQGRVDVHGLARLERAAVGRKRRQRAHVVQAVGELDDDDADVLRHREEHLAQVERLLLVHRADLDRRQLRDAVDELGDRGAEALGEVVEGRRRVLHGVVEEGRADRVGIHVEVLGENERHLDGMVDVGLARATTLVLVKGRRELVRGHHLGHRLVVKVLAAGLLQDAPVVCLGDAVSSVPPGPLGSLSHGPPLAHPHAEGRGDRLVDSIEELLLRTREYPIPEGFELAAGLQPL